ncbi:MAG: DUF2911 domain-containing protein [Ignavibacteriae bacterium]|nr:DUF2911 domain-containing protein [Ignavibacteriota bacterium]
MKRIIAVVLLAVFMVGLADAQTTPRVPRPSQGAMVKQLVGLSDVTVTYHRPGVKGRAIWGNVVKYGEPWRAGANEPTLVTFSDEVTIGGKKLGAGTYRIVVFPAEKGDWTVVFNSEVKNWGSIYEAKYDTLKMSVKPETVPMTEWMTFSFEDPTATTVTLALAWEKVRLSVPVEFNTLAKIQGSLGTWQLLASAARYAVDNNLYLNEAMGWADRSIALDRNPRNMQVKAELLAKAGKTADAIALGEEAIKMAKAKDAAANTSQLDALVAGWKKK